MTGLGTADRRHGAGARRPDAGNAPAAGPATNSAFILYARLNWQVSRSTLLQLRCAESAAASAYRFDEAVPADQRCRWRKLLH